MKDQRPRKGTSTKKNRYCPELIPVGEAVENAASRFIPALVRSGEMRRVSSWVLYSIDGRRFTGLWSLQRDGSVATIFVRGAQTDFVEVPLMIRASDEKDHVMDLTLHGTTSHGIRPAPQGSMVADFDTPSRPAE